MRNILLGILMLAFCSASAQNSNMELLGKTTFGQNLNDIWGYTDEDGNEYALVGKHYGFGIVDVTDGSTLNEVFNVFDEQTTWRDIKVWNNHAYVTCECSSGLLIVDMTPLPQSSSLNYTYWKSGDTFEFSSAHNIFIDENGVAYIFGANVGKGGAIMLDLTQDPMDPVEIGIYDEEYFHDGVARGDTLWGGAVYIGDVQVVDVSDKAEPELMSSWKTPNAFTHNMWFSDDNNYLFTTDEVTNGSIASYDVSNIFNPKEIDIWQPQDTGIIPHNTHFINDFLVTSHYTIGINIIDVKRPNNMIETGRYDTSPSYNYEGFHGCWGAYPWLPSGKILATDIETGLYVFQPTYERGCYLEGGVTDQHTGTPIFFPTIELIEDSSSLTGSLTGEYATATLNAGVYSVKVSADGYYSKTITGVVLQKGQLTQLDVELSNWPTSIDEVEAGELSVFPNPAMDELRLTSATPMSSYSIYSANGVMVQNEEIGSVLTLSIDIRDLSAGLYVLQAKSNTKLLTKQFVVE
jgi:choice-of-anchor B domain-containing protein